MRVTVESRIDVQAAPQRGWNLLCDARLPLTAPCCFKIGVPTPRSCALVIERGEVGARRQCRTAEGVVMESDTLGLERHLASMSDTFLV
jgi:hypothetical protein